MTPESACITQTFLHHELSFQDPINIPGITDKWVYKEVRKPCSNTTIWSTYKSSILKGEGPKALLAS